MWYEFKGAFRVGDQKPHPLTSDHKVEFVCLVWGQARYAVLALSWLEENVNAYFIFPSRRDRSLLHCCCYRLNSDLKKMILCMGRDYQVFTEAVGGQRENHANVREGCDLFKGWKQWVWGITVYPLDLNSLLNKVRVNPDACTTLALVTFSWRLLCDSCAEVLLTLYFS